MPSKEDRDRIKEEKKSSTKVHKVAVSVQKSVARRKPGSGSG